MSARAERDVERPIGERLDHRPDQITTSKEWTDELVHLINDPRELTLGTFAIYREEVQQ
ncbi:hypothetical protein NOU13_27770 [Rhodococcus erythropolis]|nr:hypothetical protein [Rhodococcus erythropolis]